MNNITNLIERLADIARIASMASEYSMRRRLKMDSIEQARRLRGDALLLKRRLDDLLEEFQRYF